MSTNRRDYLDELNDPLRRAAEQVRANEPPTAAEHRAIERARRTLRGKAAQRPRFRRDLLAVASMAAAILLGIVLWNSFHGDTREKSSDSATVAVVPAPMGRPSSVKLDRGTGNGIGDGLEWESGTSPMLDKSGKNPNKEDDIDLSRADVGNKSGQDLNYNLPNLGVPRVPQLAGLGTGKPTATTPTSPADPRESPRYASDTGVGSIVPSSNAPPTPGPVPRGDTKATPKPDPSSPRPGYFQPTPASDPSKPDNPGGPKTINYAPAKTPDPSPLADLTPLLRDMENKGEGKGLRNLQEQWKDLPALDRVKELDNLTKNLPVEKRQQLATYFMNLPNDGNAFKNEPDKGPVVWHRDRQQPTFARVYVGDGNSLELVSLNVTTTVEGPRARTVVDHIFRNPHPRQLEGTFEYPLPTGASPSYFAMFLGQTRDTVPARFGRREVDTREAQAALARLTPAQLVKHVDAADWGDLREARVVNNEKALETYEDVVRGRIDPALLEYAGGTTFRGRVFPIPAKGYNRVIVAYEETLPVTSGEMIYRFALPAVKLTEMKFSLQASAAECLKPVMLPKGAKQETLGSGLFFTHAWENEKPEGEIVFRTTPAESRVQTVSGRHGDNGPRYLYARLRPELKTVAKDEPFAKHAVFLLDTSLSEHPDRFNVSMMLLKRILEDDADIQSFNILAFNVGAAWVEPKGWLPNTKAGRARALARLDGIVLEGATDFSCVLDKLSNPGFDVAAGTPANCFLLSDGNITWGESDVSALVAKSEGRSPLTCRFQCYRTGLGAENLELYEALTRKGGGIFNCYGEADLKAAAQAHRNHCLYVEKVRLVGGPSTSDSLVAGRRAAVYPGGDVILTARVNGTGRMTAMVEGTFRGEKYAEEFPIEVGSTSELAPRAWAEVAVASLLALNDPKLDSLVTAYCQQFGIVGKTASFLVLENDADYKRFNLEEERGKTLVNDMGEFLDNAWATMGKAVGARELFVRFLQRIDKRVNVWQNASVNKLLVHLKDKDFELAAGAIEGGIVNAKDVPAAYLEGMKRDRREVGTYLTESRRRADKGDNAGAVRVLSSVMEEHTGRGDALRLVGYRLLDLNQPQQAARLFERVQRQRPFEPHSYRDVARSMEESGLYAVAAINYEIVLAGTWHNRFQQDLKVVVLEEYARMMQEAIRKKAVSKEVADVFGERLEGLGGKQKPADLRVTISWNTDATDVDLWVIEPDGTKCFYQHKATKNGGELSQDQTQGYGPERYQIVNAPKGTFQVLVHYYSTNPNLLGGESNVKVSVTRNSGRENEQTENHTIILKNRNEQVEVCKVKF